MPRKVSFSAAVGPIVADVWRVLRASALQVAKSPKLAAADDSALGEPYAGFRVRLLTPPLLQPHPTVRRARSPGRPIHSGAAH